MLKVGNMRYGREFFTKSFTAVTMKEAYLTACKWFATNVLSKDELHNVHVEYEKSGNEQSPTIVIHLFASLNEEELRERHCAICKEHHRAFYMQSAAPCDRCGASAYQRRADDMLRIKLDYYKSLIDSRKEEHRR